MYTTHTLAIKSCFRNAKSCFRENSCFRCLVMPAKFMSTSLEHAFIFFSRYTYKILTLSVHFTSTLFFFLSPDNTEVLRKRPPEIDISPSRLSDEVKVTRRSLSRRKVLIYVIKIIILDYTCMHIYFWNPEPPRIFLENLIKNE